MEIKHTYTYQKEIKVKYNTDICVVGGGPSGIAAALAAARHGVSVFLAEAGGFFGGAATAALVPAFMPFDNGIDFLAGGIGKEIYDLCINEGFYKNGRTIGIHSEKFKLICDRLVLAEKNINFSFFTSLIDVLKDSDDHVELAVFNAKSGIFGVKAKIFIDCTGDGDLCVFANADYKIGDENGHIMPSTLCSVWADIDWDNANVWQNKELERAFEDKVFTQEDRHLSGIWRIGEHLGGANISHSFDVCSVDEMSLTQGMITGRKILPEFEKYYREYLSEGFKNSNIVTTGSYLGVRESRRIIGDYVLNEDDFINRASFDDEIGRFSYPIDIHISKPDKKSYEAFRKEHDNMRYKDGESYGIPYRILTPKGLSNVYVAGRCVSTDKKMQSSIRVMPACYIMGQAVGIASYMAVEQNVTIRKLDISGLQDKLIAFGAYLPNRRK